MTERTRHTRAQFLTVLTALFVVPFFFSSAALAYVATQYPTEDPALREGMVVSVTDSGTAQAATMRTNVSYAGVITSKDATSVYIANEGVVSVLVTDYFGAISEGSTIGVSTIAGIAGTYQQGGVRIGTVREAPKAWDTVSVRTDDGTTQDMNISQATLQLVAGTQTESSAFGGVLGALQSGAQGIAGHPVDLWRAVVASVITVGSLLLSLTLLIVSSRHGFMSLGRNPLAGTVITKSLWRMAVVAISILCAGLVIAYLVITVGSGI